MIGQAAPWLISQILVMHGARNLRHYMSTLYSNASSSSGASMSSQSPKVTYTYNWNPVLIYTHGYSALVKPYIMKNRRDNSPYFHTLIIKSPILNTIDSSLKYFSLPLSTQHASAIWYHTHINSCHQIPQQFLGILGWRCFANTLTHLEYRNRF